MTPSEAEDRFINGKMHHIRRGDEYPQVIIEDGDHLWLRGHFTRHDLGRLVSLLARIEATQDSGALTGLGAEDLARFTQRGS
jgi:hypothetical protein